MDKKTDIPFTEIMDTIDENGADKLTKEQMQEIRNFIGAWVMGGEVGASKFVLELFPMIGDIQKTRIELLKQLLALDQKMDHIADMASNRLNYFQVLSKWPIDENN